jgi:hypothetical protein
VASSYCRSPSASTAVGRSEAASSAVALAWQTGPDASRSSSSIGFSAGSQAMLPAATTTGSPEAGAPAGAVWVEVSPSIGGSLEGTRTRTFRTGARADSRLA